MLPCFTVFQLLQLLSALVRLLLALAIHVFDLGTKRGYFFIQVVTQLHLVEEFLLERIVEALHVHQVSVRDRYAPSRKA